MCRRGSRVERNDDEYGNHDERNTKSLETENEQESESGQNSEASCESDQEREGETLKQTERHQEGARSRTPATQGGRDNRRTRRRHRLQNHSIRGFISGTLSKKMGLKVESVKSEGGE